VQQGQPTQLEDRADRPAEDLLDGARSTAQTCGRPRHQVIAAVVDKAAMQAQKRADDPSRVAWEVLIERLERFTFYERSMCAVFPDEGNYEMIRGIIREKARL
jgi:hypothetical protein